MKHVLFLMSHIGSGSDILFNALCSHPRIDGFKTNISYDHYDKIDVLISNPHKNNKSNSIWMDELLYNYSFTCKPLIKSCKFVYMIREPKGALAEISYDVERAARYYQYRIYGLCEYALRSGGYVLTYDQLNDLSGVVKYLGLGETKLVVSPRAAVSQKSEIPSEILAECEECYERHLGHLMANQAGQDHLQG